VREEWNVSPQDESILSSVVFAGMLIGAFTWGFISDRYGRRKSWHLDGYFFLFLDYWHSLGGFACMGCTISIKLEVVAGIKFTSMLPLASFLQNYT